MKGTHKIIWAFIFALYCLIPFQGPAKEKCFEHNIQLQLRDSLGFPVPGTEFWVKLNILKKGNKVTIQLPLINFVIGPHANNPFEPPFVPGGYLYTVNGFLPKHLRPYDIVNRSWLAASNNGASLPFSFTQDPSSLPIPPAGYILQITNAGALVIQGPGTFGNVIPPGPQVLLPTDISYIVKPRVKLKRNTVLSTGATNTTQFINPGAANDGFRDTHVNDAFDGVAAWAWTDNSTVADKTNGTMNLMVAIGKKGKDGKLKVRKPVQLTDLPPEVMVWDTAVAINRTNKNNIVVSYGILDFVNDTAPTYRAVSFDGGKTWPENGPTNVQPPSGEGFGDARGVSSDIYGNIWYGADDYNGGVYNPYFMVSTDGGVTFQLVYIAPSFANVVYDYPQFCFGGDGQGNYGLHFVVDYFIIEGEIFYLYPAVGFIPITSLGQFGTPSFTQLFSLPNVNMVAGITASLDGRVWTFGLPETGTNYIEPAGMIFKSPGALDLNYAGPWNYAILNFENLFYNLPIQVSQPIQGYIQTSPQSNLFDDRRQALYGIVAANYPDFSQNMRLYFSISRDNGQTWSNEIDISNTDFANRGFQSMALDSVTGDLYFGWYDGRNDPTYQSVEYYGTVIPAKQLDKLVNKIPLSNPLFSLPSAATPLGAPLEGAKLNAKSRKALKKRFEHKFRKRHRKKTAV